jgi:glucose/arabinose dehydrogenase
MHANFTWRRRRQTALVLSCWMLLAACSGGGSGSNGSDTTAPSTGVPPSSGLDSRPSNATCLAWPRPSAGSLISLTRFTDLNFTNPVAMLQAPRDDSRWFVVEQAGIIKQFNTANATSSSNFIDIVSRVSSGGELGLLGMAFHPNFPTDPRVFLSYTTGPDTMRTSRISAFITTTTARRSIRRASRAC